MPVSQSHASLNDRQFEEKIQQAIAGLNSGMYKTIKAAIQTPPHDNGVTLRDMTTEGL